jgi:hypothetical protein
VPPPLPPDLERLGEALTHATARAAAIRRARRMFAARLAACVAVAVMVLAATAPSRLGHADLTGALPDGGGVVFAAAVEGTLAVGCDRPHGAVAQRDGAPDDCTIRRPQPQAL